MADKPIINTQLVTSTRVLCDYLYSRLRSGARLSLSDKLLGIVLLSRESARAYSQDGSGDVCITPSAIGQLKGCLLSDNCGTLDFLDAGAQVNDPLRGNIAKIKT